MQLAVKRKELMPAVVTAVQALPEKNKNVITILQHVRLVADGKVLTIEGTDLEWSASVSYVTETGGQGVAIVPGYRFLDMLQRVRDDVVQFEVKEDRLRLLAGRFKGELPVHPEADSFPPIPKRGPHPKTSIQAATFEAMIERAAIAISNSAGRFALPGCFLGVKDGTMRVVTTDGSSLVYCEKTGVEGEITPSVLPLAAVKRLTKLRTKDDTSFHFQLSEDKNFLGIQTESGVFQARLLNETFPNFEKVIKGFELGKPMQVERKAFLNGLHAVVAVTEASNAFKGTLAGTETTVKLHAETPLGKADDEVDQEGRSDPTPEITVNLKKVSEWLQVSREEKVDLLLNNPAHPVVLQELDQPYTSRFYVMPIR